MTVKNQHSVSIGLLKEAQDIVDNNSTKLSEIIHNHVYATAGAVDGIMKAEDIIYTGLHHEDMTVQTIVSDHYEKFKEALLNFFGDDKYSFAIKILIERCLDKQFWNDSDSNFYIEDGVLLLTQELLPSTYNLVGKEQSITLELTQDGKDRLDVLFSYTPLNHFNAGLRQLLSNINEDNMGGPWNNKIKMLEVMPEHYKKYYFWASEKGMIKIKNL